MQQGLTRRSQKGVLRFFIGGSVDDGKSTLLGRLMHEAGAIKDDQFAALISESARFGTTGKEPDFALLVDGLEDERKQGITIDVAHRYFATPGRAFIVADTPGHENYTRNTATGASTSDLALIVVDARNGLSPQTRRHTAVANLVGVRHLLLAVNKLDRIGWDGERFRAIIDDFQYYAKNFKFESLAAIPISARYGDNIVKNSANMPWYSGPSLLAYLETVETEGSDKARVLRLPLQMVLRPDSDERLYAGTIFSGEVRLGERVRVAASSKTPAVTRILVSGHESGSAFAGQAVAIALDDHLDIGRGDIIASIDNFPTITDQFSAHLIWMGEQPLLPGRSYWLQSCAYEGAASVTLVKHRIDVETLHRDPVHTLALNEFGVCDIATASPLAVDAFAEFPETGSFLLIDRYSNATVAAGTIDFALRRGMNVKLQELMVSKRQRATLNAQRSCIVWLTGLSGAGKSTIANLVEARLAGAERHSYLLDGDNIRHGLNKDLGFTDGDRVENIRRVGEVAKLFVDAGLIVLCSFISPFAAERALVRAMVEPDEFIEVFVTAPLAVCEARDPKGLYAKSRAGRLPHFTGVDSPYEPPSAPDLVLDTTTAPAEELAQRVIDLLIVRGHYAKP